MESRQLFALISLPSWLFELLNIELLEGGRGKFLPQLFFWFESTSDSNSLLTFCKLSSHSHPFSLSIPKWSDLLLLNFYSRGEFSLMFTHFIYFQLFTPSHSMGGQWNKLLERKMFLIHLPSLLSKLFTFFIQHSLLSNHGLRWMKLLITFSSLLNNFSLLKGSDDEKNIAYFAWFEKFDLIKCFWGWNFLFCFPAQEVLSNWKFQWMSLLRVINRSTLFSKSLNLHNFSSRKSRENRHTSSSLPFAAAEDCFRCCNHHHHISYIICFYDSLSSLTLLVSETLTHEKYGFPLFLTFRYLLLSSWLLSFKQHFSSSDTKLLFTSCAVIFNTSSTPTKFWSNSWYYQRSKRWINNWRMDHERYIHVNDLPSASILSATTSNYGTLDTGARGQPVIAVKPISPNPSFQVVQSIIGNQQSLNPNQGMSGQEIAYQINPQNPYQVMSLTDNPLYQTRNQVLQSSSSDPVIIYHVGQPGVKKIAIYTLLFIILITTVINSTLIIWIISTVNFSAVSIRSFLRALHNPQIWERERDEEMSNWRGVVMYQALGFV